MYRTIVSGGFSTPLRGVRSVLTADGQPPRRYSFQVEQRFGSGAVCLVQNVMQRIMHEGTGRSMYSQSPSSLTLAGRTGTSNDSRDSQFSGFDDGLQAVVQLGRGDNGKTPLTGATGALQMWTSSIRKVHPQSPEMPMPENMVMTWVDAQTGQGSAAGCLNVVQMLYIRDSEPAQGPGCGSQNPTGEVMDWVHS